MKIEVQTQVGNSWSNSWTEDDETLRFGTVEQAMAAVDEHIDNQIQAFQAGDMDSIDSYDTFRIVNLETGEIVSCTESDKAPMKLLGLDRVPAPAAKTYQPYLDMNPNELSGLPLDFAVALSRGYTENDINLHFQQDCVRVLNHGAWQVYKPSTDKALIEQIFEDESVLVSHQKSEFISVIQRYGKYAHGLSREEAGLRCVVLSKLGEQVQIPRMLMENPDHELVENSIMSNASRMKP